jgi:3-oxoacyl-[acyl-carrier protein] reductase
MTLYDLVNSTALVTGASRKIGIGAAIARELASGGANVFITYFRAYDQSMPWGVGTREPDELLDELHAYGIKAGGLELDLGQPDAAQRLFDAVEASLGPVNILVNNATVSEPGDIFQVDAAQLDRHYAVNIRNLVLLCAEFARRFRPGLPGRIINVSSGQSAGPMPGEIAYVTTKGGVEAFTLSASAELASRGITVNAIDPGATDTGWMSADLKEELMRRAPMGRVGEPMDAAHLIRFLASREAGWITGQLIRSRGGLA